MLSNDTPKTIGDVLKSFDEQYNHDNPCGRALVLIENHEGGTSQTPAQEMVKSFIRSSCIELVESLRMEEKYNLITEKRRLTYSDVDSAYNQAVQENNQKIDALKQP